MGKSLISWDSLSLINSIRRHECAPTSIQIYKDWCTRCTLPILPISLGFSLWPGIFTTSAPTKPHVHRYVPIQRKEKNSAGRNRSFGPTSRISASIIAGLNRRLWFFFYACFSVSSFDPSVGRLPRFRSTCAYLLALCLAVCMLRFPPYVRSPL